MTLALYSISSRHRGGSCYSVPSYPTRSRTMPSHYQRLGCCHLLCAEQLEPALGHDDFNPDALRRSGSIESAADGRGSAWFVRLGEARAVLRHYYRGGMIAKLSRDQFVWSGLSRTRAFAEYRLLESMHQEGLPVPEPLGARVVRSGVFYRCDLLTRTLEDTRTFADCLFESALPEALWRELGAVIGRFHAAGVYHADLNARNILISGDATVYVIDFDRCYRRAGQAWQSDNLARLQRSLLKLAKQRKLHYDAARDWPQLVAGYQAA